VYSRLHLNAAAAAGGGGDDDEEEKDDDDDYVSTMQVYSPASDARAQSMKSRALVEPSSSRLTSPFPVFLLSELCALAFDICQYMQKIQ